jgi:hypothetical protein
VDLSEEGLDEIAVRGDEPEEVRRRWAPAASRFVQRYRSRRPHLEARGRALAVSIDAVEEEAEVEAFLAEGVALARALCDGGDAPSLHSHERCAQ